MLLKIFQNLIKNKDIRYFQKNIFYIILFRILRLYCKKEIVVNIYNFKLYCSFKKNVGSHSIIKKCRSDNETVFKSINKITKKKIVFFDCGANHGFFSLYFSKHNKKNLVFCFEASPLTFIKLKQNISLNKLKNIYAYNNAISNVSNKIVGIKQSYRDAETKITFAKNTDYKVKTINIDFFLNNLKKINQNEYQVIIKLDVEGQDLNALRGALKIIKKKKPMIIFEMSNEYLLNLKNKSYLKKFLKKYSYEIYDTNLKKTNLDKLNKKIKENKKKYNALGDVFFIETNYFRKK